MAAYAWAAPVQETVADLTQLGPASEPEALKKRRIEAMLVS